MSSDRKRPDPQAPHRDQTGAGQREDDLRSPEDDPRECGRKHVSAPDDRDCDKPSRAPESGSP